MQEHMFQLSNKTIAAVRSAHHEGRVVLFLHGWLDNSASFTPLLSSLDELNSVAIDLIGHGRSSHRPVGAEYNLLDYVQDIYELVTSQKWQTIDIVGHSLGGIIGAIFTACFPEMVRRFVCIETAGPLVEPEHTSVKQVRESIISRVKALNSVVKQPISLEDIVNSRMRVSDLSAQNARIILIRNIEYNKKNDIEWTTDHRLRTKSSLRLNEAQASNIVSNIVAPTLLILGSQGFEKVKNNYDKRKSLYSSLTMVTLSGGHHVHMDSPVDVADSILAFLNQM